MKGMHSADDRSDYIRVAHYYYKLGLTQEEISQKMNMSRQKVNRMLGKCVDLGIVEIKITGYEQTYLELETKLEKKYKLQAVRIAEGPSKEDIYKELGRVASKHLMSILKNGDIIGFSRGRSVSAMVENMPTIKKKNLIVTQLMGSWNNHQSKGNADDIVHRFSEKTDASTTMLYAPVVVQSAELRRSIMNEPFFMEAYKVIQSCTIGVVGIGDVRSEILVPTIERKEYEYCINNSAVGEICAHFFDINGNIVQTPFDDRVVNVGLEDYMNIPVKIGVAGHKSKVPAILGALRGGYINSLITDVDTAMVLLES